jgi:hypothetical protein
MTTEPPVYDLHNHPGLKFYRSALRALEEVGVPYVVGGAYAYSHYASIARDTKDFDIFIHPRDVERALAELEVRGYAVSDDETLEAALRRVGLEPDEERKRALRRLQRTRR